MKIFSNRSSMFPAAIKSLTVVLVFLAQPAHAATFSLSDDFETDAAVFESWRHSPFVLPPPPIHLDGVLYYDFADFGRGLVFEEGFLVDAFAFLDYQAVPAGASVSSGSVAFFLSAPNGPGAIELWGSEDGASWSFLDEAQAGAQLMLFHLSIGSGDPAHFLSLRATGQVLMDDLSINVSYVPLPAGLILMACGLGVLGTLRRKPS